MWEWFFKGCTLKASLCLVFFTGQKLELPLEITFSLFCPLSCHSGSMQCWAVSNPSLFSCGSSVSGSCPASFILVKMKLCKDSRLSLILLKAPLPALGRSTGVVGESVTVTLWARTSAFSWGIITPTACTLLYSFVGSPMPLRLDVKSLLHLLYF